MSSSSYDFNTGAKILKATIAISNFYVPKKSPRKFPEVTDLKLPKPIRGKAEQNKLGAA